MTKQTQFLDVIDRDEAEQRFRQAIRLEPLGEETVALRDALGRVLARDVVSALDVPSFDRSNYDGFAVQAADTYGAQEEHPRRMKLHSETVATATVPKMEIVAGTASSVATGAIVPRGADAVVMIEYADVDGNELRVHRAVTPGFGVAFAGTDIATGEIVVRRGELLTSRETGVLAAIGTLEVAVHRRPRVGIISTGDEIIQPGEPMRPGRVYDSNARILADATRELGGDPVVMGIVADDLRRLQQRLDEALKDCDVVILSGGTSKGSGDLSYRVVRDLTDPGIVAHGVALKPGKPICLAATQGKPVVILPGFPTSAIFTFHEFVAPVIRHLGGRSTKRHEMVRARLAVKVNSEVGRTEYLLVGLVQSGSSSPPCADVAPNRECDLAAYPMGKGSGSVTTFSRADGFVTIDRHTEIVDTDATVDVQLLGRDLSVADLVVIGSHCVGLDYLLGRMQDLGFHTKFLAVGSTAGLDATRREECDLAGIHLLDAKTDRYNRPFLSDTMELIPGYGRQQGVVYRADDVRFLEKTAVQAIAAVKDDPRCLMVNRNQGSGTRILIDDLLAGAQPPGYAIQARNHNAVAAAVAQGRADWGIAIKTVAAHSDLGFLPLTLEQYDFVAPRSRLERPAVRAFRALLDDAETRRHLAGWGFSISSEDR
ncbi:MAG: molybdopterin biosynthesis protein [Pirellulaceae bacterium]